MLSVTHPELLVRSYKEIYGWWLPLLGLSVYEGAQAMYGGQRPLVLSLGQVSKRPKVLQDLTST